MYADIKLKGIDVVITVQDVKTIKIKGLHSDQTEEITDFESFAFFKNRPMKYVFVGKSILHVDGNSIEYVLFR